MTKLEYKELNKLNGKSLVHYQAFEEDNPNRKIVLETTNEKMRKGEIRPPVVFDCSEITFDDRFIERINTGEIQVYLVTRGAKNYDFSYVSTASSYLYDGNRIDYESYKYGFDYQINSFQPGKNLSKNTSLFDITYQGDNGIDCMNTYTFRKASTNTCGTFTDITVCPEIGIVKSIDGSKLNGDPTLLEKYELQYVNNLPLDNFIGAACQGVIPGDPTLIVDREVPTPASATQPAITTIPALPTTAAIATSPTGSPVIAQPPVPSPQPIASLPKPGTSTSKISSYPNFNNGIEFASKGGEPVSSNMDMDCGIVKKPGFHIVKPNESLSIIAQKTGIPIRDLANWNKVKDIERIEACSELRLTAPAPTMYDEFVAKGGTDAITIPSPKPPTKKINRKPKAYENSYHTVKKGETLYSIATKHGYTVNKFMSMNGLTSSALSPGMKLKTSDCKCEIPEDEFSAKGEEFTPKGEEMTPEEYDVSEFAEVEARLTNTAKDRKTHTLQAKETVYQISKKYGISVERLMFINEIDDPSTLGIGEVLIVE